MSSALTSQIGSYAYLVASLMQNFNSANLSANEIFFAEEYA